MKIIKKLLLIGLILFVLLVLSIAGLVIALKIMYPPERIMAIAEPEIGKILQRDVKIKTASLSLYPNFGINIEELWISNTSRTIKIEHAMKLNELLKTLHLQQKQILIHINDKQIAEIDENIALNIGDVVKISRKGFSNKLPLLSLGKLFVSIKVMPLLQKQVEIEQILIDRLQLLVEVDRSGSFNFDDLMGAQDPEEAKKPKPKKEPEKTAEKKADDALPISLKMDLFQIKNSKIIYSNHKEGQEIVLDDINQTLSVQADPSMKDIYTKGLFEIKSMSFRGRGIPIRRSGMYFMVSHDLHVDLKAGKLRLNDFTFGLQKTRITTRGNLDHFDKPVRHIDLNISTNVIKLQDLFKEVPPAMFPQAAKMSVRGDTKLNIAVKGKIDAKKPGALPSINGTFRLNDAEIKYADLPQSLNQLNADIAFTQNSLHVKKFTLNVGKNPISLQAIINNFKRPTVDVLLRADLNLAELEQAIKLPPGTSVKGQIKANVSAKGLVDPKDPTAIEVKGQTDFVNIVAITPAVKKPIELNGSFKFSNREISLEQLTSRIGQSSFTMDMKIRDYLSLVMPKNVRPSKTVVTYTMTSPLLDLNEMLGISKGENENKSAAPSPATDASATSASGGSSGNEVISVPALPDVDFTGKIRVNKLIYSSLPIQNGAIDLSLRDKIVNFNLSAKLFTGTISESLVVNLSNPRQIQIRNRFSCLNMEANDFISNFNDVPKNDGKLMSQLKDLDNTIYGRMELTSDIRTQGITVNQFKNNLSGDISVRLNKGRIRNAKILSNVTQALPKVIQPFMPNLEDFSLSRILNVKLTIKQGKIHFTDLAIPLRELDLLAYGNIGLDNSIDMKMDIALNRNTSQRILAQQRRLQKAAGGLLGKANIGGKLGDAIKGKVGSMIDKVQLIPSDKQGRVVPIVGAKGQLNKIEYYLVGFKGATDDTSASDDGKPIGEQAKKMLKDQVDKAKARAKQELDKAKARAKQELDKAKARAKQELDKAKDKVEKAAAEVKDKAAAAAAKAREEAEKRKRELEKKAKDAADQAKKKAQDALKFKSPF